MAHVYAGRRAGRGRPGEDEAGFSTSEGASFAEVLAASRAESGLYSANTSKFTLLLALVV